MATPKKFLRGYQHLLNKYHIFLKRSPTPSSGHILEVLNALCVSHPGKGGCADPVNEDAILEGVGGKPPGRGRKRQLATDTGDEKT